MNQLFLIRGLPGSGKSTLAHQLGAEVFEADQYFNTLQGYKYDASKIKDAHENCQGRVKIAMLERSSRIAVANTFSQRWEMQPYLDLARQHNYWVTEITMSGAPFPNVHAVPEDKIQLMKDRWEK